LSGVVVQVVINGILVGGFYALMGMGLNVIFGVMKIVNFCQGELLMVGMYLTYLFTSALGLDPYLSLPLVVTVMMCLGAVIQQGLITPLLGAANDSNLIFMTVGLMMLMQNLALVLFKSDYRTVQTAYSLKNIHLLGQVVSLPKLISFGVLLFVTFMLYAFLMKSETGKKLEPLPRIPSGRGW